MRKTIGLLLILAGCETGDPTRYEKEEPAASESPDPARKKARISPARTNDSHLQGAIEIVACRIIPGDPPTTDITIKNATAHELEIEYRLHYFLPGEEEIVVEDSLRFVRITLDASENRVISSQPHRGGIRNVGIEIRHPFPD